MFQRIRKQWGKDTHAFTTRVGLFANGCLTFDHSPAIRTGRAGVGPRPAIDSRNPRANSPFPRASKTMARGTRHDGFLVA